MGNRVGIYIYFCHEIAYNQSLYNNVLKNGKYEKKNYLLALYDLSGGNGMV